MVPEVVVKKKSPLSVEWEFKHPYINTCDLQFHGVTRKDVCHDKEDSFCPYKAHELGEESSSQGVFSYQDIMFLNVKILL
jgi:hypothetical protein